MVELRTQRLMLRTAQRQDREGVAAVFECETVRRWWGTQSGEDVEEFTADENPDTTRMVIELMGAVIGVIQFHEEDDPMYRHAGIDVAIHRDHQRQGLASEAIRAVIDHLASLGHHRVVIDPNAANKTAIATYRSLGFREVGIMSSYEWSEHLQCWTDGLLMELLISESAD